MVVPIVEVLALAETIVDRPSSGKKVHPGIAMQSRIRPRRQGSVVGSSFSVLKVHFLPRIFAKHFEEAIIQIFNLMDYG
jgi:hypothetical protein